MLPRRPTQRGPETVRSFLAPLGTMSEGEGRNIQASLLFGYYMGAPGTGKSHVLTFVRELFKEQLAFTEGIDYVITAFQAVNAADIKGSTIHQALSLNMNFRNLSDAVTLSASKRISQWRWLFIDEVSMVSSRLLWQVERRLREVTPSAGPWKFTENGQVRPFGGINVVFMGDFLQLPPPDGGFPGRYPPQVQNGQQGESARPRNRRRSWAAMVRKLSKAWTETHPERAVQRPLVEWSGGWTPLRQVIPHKLAISSWPPCQWLRAFPRRKGVQTPSDHRPQRSQTEKWRSSRPLKAIVRKQWRQVSNKQGQGPCFCSECWRRAEMVIGNR